MELTTEQLWATLQAIEDQMFKLSSKIRLFDTLEKTENIKFVISNLEHERKVFAQVRDNLLFQIESR